MYDLMCAKPISYERNKINNPGSSKFLPTYQATNKSFFIYECVRIPCQATNKGFFIYECVPVRIPHADDRWSVINKYCVTRGGGGGCDEFLRAITSYLFRSLKGALYRIQILCRRYTFWSYPAGLTIADPPG